MQPSQFSSVATTYLLVSVLVKQLLSTIGCINDYPIVFESVTFFFFRKTGLHIWWTLWLVSGVHFMLSQYSQLWHCPWPPFNNAALFFFHNPNQWLPAPYTSFYRMLLHLQRVCPLLWCTLSMLQTIGCMWPESWRRLGARMKTTHFVKCRSASSQLGITSTGPIVINALSGAITIVWVWNVKCQKLSCVQCVARD